ncbi:MAG TPA: hypothetical protein VFI24_11230 [Pyrinomonadaceae bacterium]|nr:hypothetical protein [Pyrinomonadaceae bacterium]
MLRSYQRSWLRVAVSALLVLVLGVAAIPAKPRTLKAGKVAPKTTAAATTTFSNSGAIEISATNAGAEPEPAIPYSSDIDVIGLNGVVTGVSVTLNGLSHSSPDDLDMLLIGPSGQAFHFWSDVGGTNAVENVSLTIADTGDSPLPDSAALVDGTTYRPFNADTAGDEFPVPAQGGPYNEPASAGSATFASVFNGLTADQVSGTWNLFVTDDTDGNGGTIAGGWTLSITTGIPATTSGQLLISEFRLSGPAGADDEFIELYNATGARLTVQSADESSGLGIAASDGITRCVVPNGTQIPAEGHYLCAHAGNSLLISPDATYNTGANENVGLALFNNATEGASYSLANRLDAVGSTTEADPVYREGAGYEPVRGVEGLAYSHYRDLRPAGRPKDTNDNAADFIFVVTDPTGLDGQQLGAPGAESLSSPTQQNANFVTSLIAPCTGASVSPNRIRNLASDPDNNATFGTLSIRRKFTNNTENDITQLRFRIIDITTLPSPPGVADLRALNSTDSTENDPCNPGELFDVLGVTLDGVSTQARQPLGGGLNSTLTLSSPLAPNSSVNVNFLLGVQQTGYFRFFINIEALP